MTISYSHHANTRCLSKVAKETAAICVKNLDNCRERAKEDARMNGWHFVSSTSWVDFDHGIPQDVMNARIAAAVFLGFYERFHETQAAGTSAKFPRRVVVEPTEADCLFQSATAGEMRLSDGTLRTLMAGLACRGPSPAAWKILEWLASDFVAVPDSVAADGMKALAEGKHDDVPVVCGESSAAKMGVLLKAGGDSTLRDRLGLNEHSQCVIFGLKGATDPKIYRELVGKLPEDVFKAQDDFLHLHG
ncbi:tryptophan synthase beta subunit-like PLP-dependent enzyme [Xylaria flabelliformis]|nr:tryptophan synthase beta subunit-like PLP-dependent enzyme [Xylaria flabelliformis]